MSVRSTIGGVLRRAGLGPCIDRLSRHRSARRERRRQAAWRAGLEAALAGGSDRELVAGRIEPSALPVIMCLWDRPERLAASLEELAHQSLDRPIRLVLWNNRREHSSRVREEVARARLGAITSVELVDSAVNLGGVARFVVARDLARGGYSGAFITVDDDQVVGPTFLADLVAEHARDRIAGVWAWVHGDEYWDRRRARAGEVVDYVGTGGAVFDTGIVADRAFFDRLPDRYGFLEDMWACAWVRAGGGELRAVEAPWRFAEDDRDQYLGLIGLKPEFARYLAESAPRGPA